jgi:hypothetical protein
MWAEKELEHMDFNDMRLNQRLEKILESFTDRPSASIPAASKSKYDAKATYRFLSNDNVATKEIRRGYYAATKERIEQKSEGKTILFASDASNIVLTSHKKLKGIGVLRNQKARGLCLHTTLAYTEEELVLGVVHQVCWGRKPEDYGQRALRSKKPIEEKESYRWIEAFKAAQEALPDKATGIFMGDRGADLYELFLEKRKSNMVLLIRALHDRQLSDSEERMFAKVEKSSCAGILNVSIQRSGDRKARTARLEIRYEYVSIQPPKNKKDLSPIFITVVWAKEIVDDPSTRDQIDWRLLITLPIDSFDQAIYAVRTYAKRWLIERYHYTLKEGCKVEELQLEEADRIDKAIAIYTIVACRIMYMTYLARTAPDEPCITIFSNDEWHALYCYVKKTSIAPKDPPTNREAVLMLATIGGFLDRKCDGAPGVKVIWRGITILEGAVEMYRILTREKRCG